MAWLVERLEMSMTPNPQDKVAQRRRCRIFLAATLYIQTPRPQSSLPRTGMLGLRRKLYLAQMIVCARLCESQTPSRCLHSADASGAPAKNEWPCWWQTRNFEGLVLEGQAWNMRMVICQDSQSQMTKGTQIYVTLNRTTHKPTKSFAECQPFRQALHPIER